MAVELIDKIKPKNGGDFPLVDAADVEMPDGTRMDKALDQLREDLTGAGVVVSATPPEDTRVFWVDTGDNSSGNTTNLAAALGEIDALLGGEA